MKTLLLPLALLAGLTRPAAADQLDRDLIPAEARWLVHVDLEALGRSRLYERLLEEQDFELELPEEDELAFLANVDFFGGDVKSVTAYGNAPDTEDAVLMVVASEKIEEALSALRVHLSVRDVRSGQHVLQHWTQADEDESMYSWLATRPGGGERVLLVGKSRSTLTHAVDVMQGSAPSQAGSPSPALTTRPSPGSIFFAAANDLSRLAEFDPSSRVAGLTRALSVDLGENAGTVFLYLVADSESAADTRQVQQVLQGLTALAGLMVPPEGDAAYVVQNLLGAFRFEASGSRLLIEFRYDAEHLVDDLKLLENL
jgi:hypothetical protein